MSDDDLSDESREEQTQCHESADGGLVPEALDVDERLQVVEVAGHGSGFARPVAQGDFWTCGAGIHALDDPTPFGQENALQKLGKPPFEKSTRSRFRLLGYLATMYEHVSQDVARNANIKHSTSNIEVPERSDGAETQSEAESEI